MDFLIEQNIDNPWVLAAGLFLATFVLEEAAIVLAAGLAATGQLITSLALAAVGSGVIVSDWSHYALGALAGRNRRIAGWIPPERVLSEQNILRRAGRPLRLNA